MGKILSRRRDHALSFQQAVDHSIEFGVLGQADQEFVLQHSADFCGGDESSLGGGAAGRVLGELAVAQREPAAGWRAGGSQTRDEVRIRVGG